MTQKFQKTKKTRQVAIVRRTATRAVRRALPSWQYGLWIKCRPVGQSSWLKSGGCCAPLHGGELGPQLTQCHLGRGIPPYQVVSWSIQPFSQNRHAPKVI